MRPTSPLPEVTLAGNGAAHDVPYPVPLILRIDALIRLPDGAGQVINRASVSARDFRGWVEWPSGQVDPRLRRGDLARAIPLHTPAARIRPVHILLPLNGGNLSD